MGSFLYSYPTSSNLALQGYKCYQEFRTIIQLEVSVRQQNIDNNPDQEEFIKLLLRLRNRVDNDQTVEDWKFILKRKITPLLLEEFDDAIRLFPDNASCANYNNQKLKQLKNPICKLTASNSSSYARNLDDENFFGLKNQIFLWIGAKINLTTNLWTQKG